MCKILQKFITSLVYSLYIKTWERIKDINEKLRNISITHVTKKQLDVSLPTPTTTSIRISITAHVFDYNYSIFYQTATSFAADRKTQVQTYHGEDYNEQLI